MNIDRGSNGEVIKVSGPVIEAIKLDNVRLQDVVRVGDLGLLGEVIRVSKELITIQVYEDCTGIHVGEQVRSTYEPLTAKLGPGLLGMIYDGLQRPLRSMAVESGEFIKRGVDVPPLPTNRLWKFYPCVAPGTKVAPGSILGRVPESRTIDHLIMVPPGIHGKVIKIEKGEFSIKDTVAVINPEASNSPHKITLLQEWPVRHPRPFQARIDPREPLITGTRIIDLFFPVAKGGSAVIPGGFGTGKTVIEQALAKWADADVVVYIGCGERGNEMTEVLEEFPTLEDPRTGSHLMERTVLIANTSNMPVAAREASIYLGITIAEYYRDMGYDILLLADSTSRWGEALREISGRLEEMPGEEGYPAYLAARLAEFYERSGRVICQGNVPQERSQRTGSVTVVGAVSPPGGDFSEPITQASMRVAGTFWALDYELSRRRHFPAISWINSYSLHKFNEWFSSQIANDLNLIVSEAKTVLQREVELLEIVQLVGPDALAETEKGILAVARMIREDFLQQSAYHEVDRYCSIEKAYWMLKVLMTFHHHTQTALKSEIPLAQIFEFAVIEQIARMKDILADDARNDLQILIEKIDSLFSEMGATE